MSATGMARQLAALVLMVPSVALFSALLALPPHPSLYIGVETTVGTPAIGGGRPVGPVVQRGIAKYYDPGVFAQVARNRGMELRQDAGVDGYAAVASCGRIGSVVLAQVGTLPIQRYQVIDCSQTSDQPEHSREGLIIEVDHATARKAGLIDGDCTDESGVMAHGCGPAVIYGYDTNGTSK